MKIMMSRDEFLNELRKYLSGISESDKNDTIEFYNNYFNDQMASGRSEQDIIDELGSPRLLAKSIKDNRQGRDDSYSKYSNDGNINTQEREGDGEYNFYDFRQISWKNKIFAVLILILVIILIATLIAGVVTLFVKIVIPVLVILAIVGIIKNLFNR